MTPEDRRLSEGEQVPFIMGHNNDSVVISQVAAQLAQIGDKLELAYQRRNPRNQDILSVKAVCIVAIFLALRVSF